MNPSLAMSFIWSSLFVAVNAIQQQKDLDVDETERKQIRWATSLPEITRLSGVSTASPSALYRSLGKCIFARVSSKIDSANK